MADQLAPQFTGTYGHPLVKTPHMDALAAAGARFDAAYCNSPLCAPSRFSLMSGRLITQIGAYDNASEFPASVPTFAHALRRMGYSTCLSGKMHFVGPDQLHGFEERVTTDVYPSDYAWTPDWENPDQRIEKWYHNMDSVTEAGLGNATFQLDYDDEVAFFAKRRIFDYARDRETPFCLVASFIHPHDPYVARPEWWDLYKTDQIDLPKVGFEQALEDPFSARLRDGIEASVVPVSDTQLRQARQGYYGNTSYFDDKVGQIVQTLDEANLLDNTMIIVTSDHGDMLGERGLWYKMNFFEHSARIPLIIKGPGINPVQVPNACSLVDIFPTVLDMAGSQDAAAQDIGQPIDGHSLLPLARGEPDDYDEAIGEYCAEMTAAPVFMIRRGPFKYVSCQGDPAQLYNLELDPDERVNLAGRADHAEIVAQFSAESARRWDPQAIIVDVIASQKRRRRVYEAMTTGRMTSWDFNPRRDANQEFVRNHMDWTEAAQRARFPRVESDGKA
jgi:choline-sulfatase